MTMLTETSRSNKPSASLLPIESDSSKMDRMHIRGDLRIRYGQVSDAGAKPNNEDCIGIRIPKDDLLATKGLASIISDGVSSAEAGGEAAEICVQGFLADYFSTPDSWQVKTSAHRILASLNGWLHCKSQSFSDLHKGYLCAMSLLIIKSRTAHIFHVGDTRVYRLKDGMMDLLTQDHQTWVSNKTRYLTRAMGMNLHLDMDYRKLDIHNGDIFFLSTDGIHDYLKETQIKHLIYANRNDLDQGCADILKAALQNGSPDNLSCQLIYVDQLHESDPKDIYAELGSLPFPPDLQPGMILDGYEVERILSTNARSQLYLVFDPENGDHAVMKTPSTRFNDDPAYIERFIMEEWIGKRMENR
ncbi:MAG TPA: serine/threonine-protein phosphatase, partial [Verrucomicrobia bacterium]|nr:serine/threonine-protein phosphatase [Verrucomicrobiota bacterium]